MCGFVQDSSCNHTGCQRTPVDQGAFGQHSQDHCTCPCQCGKRRIQVETGVRSPRIDLHPSNPFFKDLNERRVTSDGELDTSLSDTSDVELGNCSSSVRHDSTSLKQTDNREFLATKHAPMQQSCVVQSSPCPAFKPSSKYENVNCGQFRATVKDSREKKPQQTTSKPMALVRPQIVNSGKRFQPPLSQAPVSAATPTTTMRQMSDSGGAPLTVRLPSWGEHRTVSHNSSSSSSSGGSITMETTMTTMTMRTTSEDSPPCISMDWFTPETAHLNNNTTKSCTAQRGVTVVAAGESQSKPPKIRLIMENASGSQTQISEISLSDLQNSAINRLLPQHSAVLKRTSCQSQEYTQKDWGRVTGPPSSSSSSSSSSPPLSPNNPFHPCASTSSPLATNTLSLTTRAPAPLPPVCMAAIDEYTKVCGYDASKDQVLQRTYQLLAETRCYYGDLTMQEARRKLKHATTGAYLLRNSSDPAHLFSLSVKTPRGTTSIRISYNLGEFALDCEEAMAGKMPPFDCLLKLLDFYTAFTSLSTCQRNSSHGNSSTCVFLESTGRRDTRVVLTRPYVHSVAPLKALARRALNNMLSDEQRQRVMLFMPPAVEQYMQQYPYRI